MTIGEIHWVDLPVRAIPQACPVDRYAFRLPYFGKSFASGCRMGTRHFGVG